MGVAGMGMGHSGGTGSSHCWCRSGGTLAGACDGRRPPLALLPSQLRLRLALRPELLPSPWPRWPGPCRPLPRSLFALRLRNLRRTGLADLPLPALRPSEPRPRSRLLHLLLPRPPSGSLSLPLPLLQPLSLRSRPRPRLRLLLCRRRLWYARSRLRLRLRLWLRLRLLLRLALTPRGAFPAPLHLCPPPGLLPRPRGLLLRPPREVPVRCPCCRKPALSCRGCGAEALDPPAGGRNAPAPAGATALLRPAPVAAWTSAACAGAWVRPPAGVVACSCSSGSGGGGFDVSGRSGGWDWPTCTSAGGCGCGCARE